MAKTPCSHQFHPAFSLGPLSLGYPIVPGGKTWVAELAFEQCAHCLLVKTVNQLPTETLAHENFYSSKVAQVVSSHDAAFAQMATQRAGIAPGQIVLEIGSGDGNLLNLFAAKGATTIGVDPAPHSGEKYAFDFIQGFYTQETCERLLAENRAPDLVIANYVLELIPDIEDFLKSVANVLKPSSHFVFEVPYLSDFMKTPRLDGFAHLRCNWFTATSVYSLCEGQGLGVTAIEHLPEYRGGTLRVWTKVGESEVAGPVEKRLLEEEAAFFSPAMFELFQARNNRLREDVRSRLLAAAHAGALVGYGGGLKAATLVNWLGLGKSDFSFIVDADPNKQGKLMPLANIPILPVSALTDSKQDGLSVVLLAFDHQSEVLADLKGKLPTGSQFIRIFPSYTVESLQAEQGK